MHGKQTRREVWITGIGLVSSVGEGVEAHVDMLSDRRPARLTVDETTFAPYPIHPLAPLDLSRQIPKNSDQRQMEDWQKIGVYAAGLALEDAGLKNNPQLLGETDLVVAAGSGERDTTVDCKILEADLANGGSRLLAAQILPGALRPTLFLAQLSNLLAGNISIVHHVTGSSRTFMGEEMAGLSAVENAFSRVAARQSQRCLVGGALNAQRQDLLLAYELGHNLWRHPYCPVAERGADGGFIPGSVGAFVVVETPECAVARGASPYCRILSVRSARSGRASGAVKEALSGMLNGTPAISGPSAVFSGASGVAPLAAEEMAFINGVRAHGFAESPLIYGDLIGHGVEAHFPAGIALASLALKSRAPARRGHVLVTSVGHWRGEGLALLQSVS
jgi:3-oxoacyl-[acyl-carrier-protein] synthase II